MNLSMIFFLAAVCMVVAAGITRLVESHHEEVSSAEGKKPKVGDVYSFIGVADDEDDESFTGFLRIAAVVGDRVKAEQFNLRPTGKVTRCDRGMKVSDFTGSFYRKMRDKPRPPETMEFFFDFAVPPVAEPRVEVISVPAKAPREGAL